MAIYTCSFASNLRITTPQNTNIRPKTRPSSSCSTLAASQTAFKTLNAWSENRIIFAAVCTEMARSDVVKF